MAIHVFIKVSAFSMFCATQLGCGSGSGSQTSMPGCSLIGFAMLVRPANPLAAPDHAAMPPGNQETFVAGEGSEVGPGCASTNLYKTMPAQWQSSDPKSVSISSAADATNGVATCIAATSAVTISATLTDYGFTQTLSSPDPIVCK